MQSKSLLVVVLVGLDPFKITFKINPAKQMMSTTC